jgi:Secretion system C-terminal sorting domain/SprB repeat
MRTKFTKKLYHDLFQRPLMLAFQVPLVMILLLGFSNRSLAQPAGYAWRLQANGNFGSPYVLSNNTPTTGILSTLVSSNSTANEYLIEWDSYANKWSNINTPKNAVTTFFWGGGNFNGPNGSLTGGFIQNKHYTLQIRGLGYSNRQGVIMETDNAPVSFAVSNPVVGPTNVCVSTDASITINLGIAKSSQERVFVRYSKLSNFASSKVVEATGVGSNWATATAVIPAVDNQPSGTIYYYAYSTTVASDNSTDHDLVTLKFGNNGGSNYSYTIVTIQNFPVWYLDNDNDGWYVGTGIVQCTSPGAGYKSTGLSGGGDCDDNNPAVTGAIACLDGSITGATTVACYSDFTVKLTAAGSGGTAPYTYLWSTGQSGAVINNAGAGTYSVTISDAGGQTKVVNHIITGPTAVSATFVVTNQKCEDPAKGTIVATAFGGTPGYEYALDFGAWQNSGTFTIVPTGWHTINIKDANGCQGKVSALVTKLASSMTLSAVRTGISFCGGTGTITATAGGGVDPYEYKLGDAGTYQSSGTFTGLAAGSYKVIAKDNIGCTVTRNYIISDNGKDGFESNNALGSAKIISLNTNVNARIGTATDQDWFKFNTGSAGDFDITLSHGTVNYNLQLFTNAGGLITPVSQTGNTISYTGLEFASTYRIQITGAQSFNCYNLMVAPSIVVSGAEMLTSKTVAPDELKAQPFPNPHNGSIILQVESPVTGKGSIVLYDLQGRTMVTREENLRAGTNQVRFSNLQPINYFYRVMVGGKSTSGKVFKQ